VEQKPQAIVLEVAHAMSDPADLLSDQVLGFDSSGRDVRRMQAWHLLLPARDAPRKAGELYDVGFSRLGVEPYKPPVGLSRCQCEVAFA
jgi:hypothetical protein